MTLTLPVIRLPRLPLLMLLSGALWTSGLARVADTSLRYTVDKTTRENKPYVIDVIMQNEPVPTAGHWNIMDIYSPGKKVSHVSTEGRRE